jgi:predicted CoA-binding protein
MMQSSDIFSGVKTIAIVGLSDKPDRASYQVAEYLISQGYEVVPVNPMITEVFGRKSYASIEAIPKAIKVDLVDIFRKSEEVHPIVCAAILRGVMKIWLQEGVKNEEAAQFAREHGAEVVMDVCLMKTMKSSAYRK